jgi:hypothetical protein
MRRFPTCRLPSSDKTEPNPLVGNKSEPLMPLLPMARYALICPRLVTEVRAQCVDFIVYLQVSSNHSLEIPPGPRGIPVRC